MAESEGIPAAKVEIRGTDRSVLYHTPNKMCAWRAQTIYEKEPITIEWMDRLKEEDTLWDVGANVGLYTCYAAVRSGCQVIAFEPESQNFAALNMNIALNHLSERVTAYPVGLDVDTAPMPLYLTQFGAGGSCHQLGDQTSWSGKKDMASVFRQGGIAVSPAWLCENGVAAPTHVKIDVDGHEPLVVEGLLDTWSLAPPSSLIIEVCWPRVDHCEMVKTLEKAGYKWSQEQADAAKRKDGAFKDVGEVVFDLI